MDFGLLEVDGVVTGTAEVIFGLLHEIPLTKLSSAYVKIQKKDEINVT